LAEVIEGWMIIRIKKGTSILPFNDKTIQIPAEMTLKELGFEAPAFKNSKTSGNIPGRVGLKSLKVKATLKHW
jgi:hypothetical protein